MLKKLVIASAVLVATTSVVAGPSYKGEAMAQPAPCPVYTYSTGPYIGFSVGSRTNFSNTSRAFSGADFNLSAGYGAMLTPDFYLAGEIFALDTAKITNYAGTSTAPSTLGQSLSLQSTWGFGASILPGYMINERVLGYLRGGVVRSRFSQQHGNATGGQFGLGVQTALDHNWDLRAEYDWTWYNKISGGPVSTGNPRSSVFNLGVVYKFV